MDWKTFIANIISSAAWPLVVVFLIYQLKDRLAELLPRLKRLKHKDTELEFAERLNELAIDSEASKEKAKALEKRPEIDEQYKFLIRLSGISSRSAVIESYRVLENAAAKAVARAYPELEREKTVSHSQIQKLLRDKILDKMDIYQYAELTQLRNQAAHMEDFEMENMLIEVYIELALTLANEIENYVP
jgi:hypothetical protein